MTLKTLSEQAQPAIPDRAARRRQMARSLRKAPMGTGSTLNAESIWGLQQQRFQLAPPAQLIIGQPTPNWPTTITVGATTANTSAAGALGGGITWQER